MVIEVEERDYVTVGEAARALRVSPATVRRWIEAKRLPADRVGARTLRIKKADLATVVAPERPETAGAAEAGVLDAFERQAIVPKIRPYVFVPPSAEEIARRQEVVARILANQKGRSIAPLTSADLIRQVREEREERYRSWSKPSS